MNNFKEVYKTRAEAYRHFILPQKLPCSERKFYNDMDRLHLVQTDKTIRLADLLAYVRSELQINPVTGQSLVEKDQEQERREWEIRKLKAEVEAKELSGRKEDDKWLLKEEAYAVMAAIVGLLRDTLRHHFHLKQNVLVLQAGGDQSRAPELYEGLEEVLAAAFNDVAEMESIEVMFESPE